MSTIAHCTPAPRAVPGSPPYLVSLFVADTHPLLQLKRALDWPALQAVMVRHWRAAGKNVDGRPGLPWPVALYVPLLVLMAVKALSARQMEEYGTENVVARVFLDLAENPLPHLRDHSNIARAQAALGTAGWQQINHLVVTEAVRLGFGKPQLLSADTTVQEPQIGYPHEAGILRGIAQRVYRAAVKLKNRGCQHAQAAIEKAKEVFSRVKDYHLFAKTKHAKDQALKKILRHSKQLLSSSREVIKQVGRASTTAAHAAVAKLQQMGEVSGVLIPQIEQWMKTGKVARHKILHPGITQARSIVKKSAGKKVAFGLKWLINRISGGYIFGKVVDARADERQMPLAALQNYREVFGAQASPEMAVYDRGGSCAQTVEKLQKAGVKKVGIQPAGKAPWSVAEADQKEVGSQRGQTEGSIGTLKSRKYDFSGGSQRSNESLRAAGQRAMVCMNLVNLLRDIVEKDRTMRTAVV
jgi:hypothetical protein